MKVVKNTLAIKKAMEVFAGRTKLDLMACTNALKGPTAVLFTDDS